VNGESASCHGNAPAHEHASAAQRSAAAASAAPEDKPSLFKRILSFFGLGA
jgi:hypothetical protein